MIGIRFTGLFGHKDPDPPVLGGFVDGTAGTGRGTHRKQVLTSAGGS